MEEKRSDSASPSGLSKLFTQKTDEKKSSKEGVSSGTPKEQGGTSPSRLGSTVEVIPVSQEDFSSIYRLSLGARKDSGRLTSLPSYFSIERKWKDHEHHITCHKAPKQLGSLEMPPVSRGYTMTSEHLLNRKVSFPPARRVLGEAYQQARSMHIPATNPAKMGSIDFLRRHHSEQRINSLKDTTVSQTQDSDARTPLGAKIDAKHVMIVTKSSAHMSNVLVASSKEPFVAVVEQSSEPKTQDSQQIRFIGRSQPEPLTTKAEGNPKSAKLPSTKPRALEKRSQLSAGKPGISHSKHAYTEKKDNLGAQVSPKSEIGVRRESSFADDVAASFARAASWIFRRDTARGSSGLAKNAALGSLRKIKKGAQTKAGGENVQEQASRVAMVSPKTNSSASSIGDGGLEKNRATQGRGNESKKTCTEVEKPPATSPVSSTKPGPSGASQRLEKPPANEPDVLSIPSSAGVENKTGANASFDIDNDKKDKPVLEVHGYLEVVAITGESEAWLKETGLAMSEEAPKTAVVKRPLKSNVVQKKKQGGGGGYGSVMAKRPLQRQPAQRGGDQRIKSTARSLIKEGKDVSKGGQEDRITPVFKDGLSRLSEKPSSTGQKVPTVPSGLVKTSVLGPPANVKPSTGVEAENYGEISKQPKEPVLTSVITKVFPEKTKSVTYRMTSPQEERLVEAQNVQPQQAGQQEDGKAVFVRKLVEGDAEEIEQSTAGPGAVKKVVVVRKLPWKKQDTEDEAEYGKKRSTETARADVTGDRSAERLPDSESITHGKSQNEKMLEEGVDIQAGDGPLQENVALKSSDNKPDGMLLKKESQGDFNLAKEKASAGAMAPHRAKGVGSHALPKDKPVGSILTAKEKGKSKAGITLQKPSGTSNLHMTASREPEQGRRSSVISGENKRLSKVAQRPAKSESVIQDSKEEKTKSSTEEILYQGKSGVLKTSQAALGGQAASHSKAEEHVTPDATEKAAKDAIMYEKDALDDHFIKTSAKPNSIELKDDNNICAKGTVRPVTSDITLEGPRKETHEQKAAMSEEEKQVTIPGKAEGEFPHIICQPHEVSIPGGDVPAIEGGFKQSSELNDGADNEREQPDGVTVQLEASSETMKHSQEAGLQNIAGAQKKEKASETKTPLSRIKAKAPVAKRKAPDMKPKAQADEKSELNLKEIVKVDHSKTSDKSLKVATEEMKAAPTKVIASEEKGTAAEAKAKTSKSELEPSEGEAGMLGVEEDEKQGPTTKELLEISEASDIKAERNERPLETDIETASKEKMETSDRSESEIETTLKVVDDRKTLPEAKGKAVGKVLQKRLPPQLHLSRLQTKRRSSQMTKTNTPSSQKDSTQVQAKDTSLRSGRSTSHDTAEDQKESPMSVAPKSDGAEKRQSFSKATSDTANRETSALRKPLLSERAVSVLGTGTLERLGSHISRRPSTQRTLGTRSPRTNPVSRLLKKASRPMTSLSAQTIKAPVPTLQVQKVEDKRKNGKHDPEDPSVKESTKKDKNKECNEETDDRADIPESQRTEKKEGERKKTIGGKLGEAPDDSYTAPMLEVTKGPTETEDKIIAEPEIIDNDRGDGESIAVLSKASENEMGTITSKGRDTEKDGYEALESSLAAIEYSSFPSVSSISRRVEAHDTDTSESSKKDFKVPETSGDPKAQKRKGSSGPIIRKKPSIKKLEETKAKAHEEERDDKTQVVPNEGDSHAEKALLERKPKLKADQEKRNDTIGTRQDERDSKPEKGLHERKLKPKVDREENDDRPRTDQDKGVSKAERAHERENAMRQKPIEKVVGRSAELSKNDREADDVRRVKTGAAKKRMSTSRKVTDQNVEERLDVGKRKKEINVKKRALSDEGKEASDSDETRAKLPMGTKEKVSKKRLSEKGEKGLKVKADDNVEVNEALKQVTDVMKGPQESKKTLSKSKRGTVDTEETPVTGSTPAGRLTTAVPEGEKKKTISAATRTAALKTKPLAKTMLQKTIKGVTEELPHLLEKKGDLRKGDKPKDSMLRKVPADKRKEVPYKPTKESKEEKLKTLGNELPESSQKEQFPNKKDDGSLAAQLERASKPGGVWGQKTISPRGRQNSVVQRRGGETSYIETVEKKPSLEDPEATKPEVVSHRVKSGEVPKLLSKIQSSEKDSDQVMKQDMGDTLSIKPLPAPKMAPTAKTIKTATPKSGKVPPVGIKRSITGDDRATTSVKAVVDASQKPPSPASDHMRKDQRSSGSDHEDAHLEPAYKNQDVRVLLKKSSSQDAGVTDGVRKQLSSGVKHETVTQPSGLHAKGGVGVSSNLKVTGMSGPGGFKMQRKAPPALPKFRSRTNSVASQFGGVGTVGSAGPKGGVPSLGTGTRPLPTSSTRLLSKLSPRGRAADHNRLSAASGRGGKRRYLLDRRGKSSEDGELDSGFQGGFDPLDTKLHPGKQSYIGGKRRGSALSVRGPKRVVSRESTLDSGLWKGDEEVIEEGGVSELEPTASMTANEILPQQEVTIEGRDYSLRFSHGDTPGYSGVKTTMQQIPAAFRRDYFSASTGRLATVLPTIHQTRESPDTGRAFTAEAVKNTAAKKKDDAEEPNLEKCEHKIQKPVDSIKDKRNIEVENVSTYDEQARDRRYPLEEPQIERGSRVPGFGFLWSCSCLPKSAASESRFTVANASQLPITRSCLRCCEDPSLIQGTNRNAGNFLQSAAGLREKRESVMFAGTGSGQRFGTAEQNIDYIAQVPLQVKVHRQLDVPTPSPADIEKYRKRDAAYEERQHGLHQLKWFFDEQQRKMDDILRLKEIQEQARWKTAPSPFI